MENELREWKDLLHHTEDPEDRYSIAQILFHLLSAQAVLEEMNERN